MGQRATVFELLRQEQMQLGQLMNELAASATEDPSTRLLQLAQVRRELVPHFSALRDTIYDDCRGLGTMVRLAIEGDIEIQDEITAVLAYLEGAIDDDDAWTEGVAALSYLVWLHVEETETEFLSATEHELTEPDALRLCNRYIAHKEHALVRMGAMLQ